MDAVDFCVRWLIEKQGLITLVSVEKRRNIENSDRCLLNAILP